ncbi:MAG TPA: protein-disulfide reductase DsbD domain-containing protein, partial [Isosphaeraceae bacterium]|nr:protein-disulfide reductase DsbD domain-containing protein [Isosphaeraceae bacterium]
SAVVRRTLAGAAAGRPAPLSRAAAAAGRDALAEQFDPDYGGFGFNPENARRPKFPEPANLVFLLDQYRRDPKGGGKTPPGPREMVVTTLDHMARGGIRDQLAGGYHRYATSRYWIVPHFEKMLYDNAQLASAHLLAFELTADPRWRAEAEATFAFIARTMTDPDGGFYSALDAETGGEEGRYYVWTRDEVKLALGDGPDQEAFSQVYGLKREPNFEKNRYVLLEPRTRAEQAPTLNTTPAALEGRLAPLRAKLLAVRDRRPAPLRDDKVLTSWNGLTIAAYADGFRVLKDPRYRAAAEKAADFLWAKLRTPDGRLLRTYRAGRAKLPAYLEDYAFFAHGLLRLHAATGDPKRLAQARALTDRMIADFSDEKDGGFFYTADDHESLIARTKDANDGVIPAGNSVAARNLVALAAALKEPRYLDAAGKTLNAFSGRLAQSPSMMPLMLVALEEYLDARPDAAADAAPVVPPGRGSQDVVTVEVEKVQPVVLDGPVHWQATLSLTIKEGWHIYANPTGVEGIAPTQVIGDEPALKVLKVEYPPGVPKLLSSSGKEKVAVYEGKVSVLVWLTDTRGPGATSQLTVRIQACNDRACLAPASIPVKVWLPVPIGNP